MLVMTIEQPFKDRLFAYFKSWEELQPKKRSSFSAFARWLSNNTMKVQVKQQVVDSWMNGSIPKDHKFVAVLAEKIGIEIFDWLDLPRPNQYLKLATEKWEFMSEEKQKQISSMIAEEAAKYEAKRRTEGVQEVSKRRKTL